ncbi:coenzyme A pyrophosphatase, partial [Streptomyces sp. NPDC057638]
MHTGEETQAAGTDRAHGVTVTAEGLPPRLRSMARALETVAPEQLSVFLPPATGRVRQSAV